MRIGRIDSRQKGRKVVRIKKRIGRDPIGKMRVDHGSTIGTEHYDTLKLA